ncbi:MAG: chemotaxis protein CheA [Ilumatobacteraceae bacterium]
MSEMDEIISDFLVESHEGLDRLDQDLVNLEEHGGDDVLASIFRTMHTLKGTCGFLGFSRLESVAHAAENLLSLLRDKVMPVSGDITTALLSTVDAVRAMLARIESDGDEGTADYSALVLELERLQAAPTESAPVSAPAPAASSNGSATPPKVRRPGGRKQRPAATDATDLPSTAEPAPAAPQPAPTLAVTSAEPAPGEDGVTPVPALAEARGSSAVADSSIRVDVDLLDTLMNLVGELVLARNQILQLTAGQDSALLAPAQRLNLITTELQEGVMKTRMQPIGNVWSKFPRVVRDLAVSCGKHVRLEMDGADTELDKTIIEAIKDPLTHLVRNAIDHGIESPEKRAEAGKPTEGRLLLRAYHEGGRVNIEIVDDGRGIDTDAVRAKAIERGVVTAEQAARFGQRELLNLIFMPGFSTASTVSNISGRGVGMDVVKTNIERIGGSVDVLTEPGRGSTVKVSIPLTLAIIPALVVTSGMQRYAIPQISLLELVRLDRSQPGTGIELIQGAPVYRLRGRLLPIVFLADELHPGARPGRDADDGVVNIVVLQADDRQFGLVVDQINDTQEIVVKPLGRLLKDVTTFAGATNMGDGRVALILDVLGLAHRSHVVSAARERALAEQHDAAASSESEVQTLLLLAVGGDRRVAIPLSAVARLDEFPASSVELVGNDSVVQYRGEILRLIDLASVLGYGRGGGDDTLHVVVYTHPRGRVGFIVDGVVDIVDAAIDSSTTSLVIDGRVTELADVAHLASSALGSVTLPELAFFDRLPDDFTDAHHDFALATSGASNGAMR